MRKSMIALAAITALSTALVSADAFAKPNGGGKGGGWGKGGGHWGGWHQNYRHYGHNSGFYGFGGYEPDCYQVMTRHGYVRTICSY